LLLPSGIGDAERGVSAEGTMGLRLYSVLACSSLPVNVEGIGDGEWKVCKSGGGGVGERCSSMLRKVLGGWAEIPSRVREDKVGEWDIVCGDIAVRLIVDDPVSWNDVGGFDPD